MNPRSHDLFTQAAVLEPGARKAFIAENCGDDEELRDEVLAMLAEAERADSLFDWDDAEIPTMGPESFAELLEKEGDVIGAYTLRQQIGEGGFGTVWMAEQKKPIARMVALKVVKAGMDTRQILTRFEAERQALAMMDHPNIARVIDAGATESGRPYFAMELVKGVPITQFCKEQKYDARRRLELFKDVCSAVNHAHQKGIIHRDLKPSNVMVTLHGDQPVPKVIDFGIAKATQGKLTDQTLFTRYEQFLGTPAYMSPEQTTMSGLDIDTRADIYSLGVLLYELLAGQPPFDQKSLLSAGYEEMRRIIREDEPPKPSTRLTQTQSDGEGGKLEVTASNLKGELDWIVMKAIDKDRARRYETAYAFASDIGRFLNDEAVEAAAPTTSYRLRKFVRRNRVALAVVASFTLLLVLATAVSTWQAIEAERLRSKEEEARRKAEASEEQERQARIRADETATLMRGMFRLPHSKDRGRKVTVAEALDHARKKVEENASISPEVKATLLDDLASTYKSLGLYEESIILYERTLDHWRLGPESNTMFWNLQELSNAYRALEENNKAQQYCEEALELSLRLNGPTSPHTLAQKTNLSDFLTPEEAVEILEEVLALTKETPELDDSNLLSPSFKLAALYANRGDLEEAATLLEEFVQPGMSTLDSTLNDLLTQLSLIYSGMMRLDEAQVGLEQAFLFSAEVEGPTHLKTLICMINLASNYLMVGRAVDGERWVMRTFQMVSERFGNSHPLSEFIAATTLPEMRTGQGFFNLQEAADTLTEAAKLFPQNEKVVAELGRTLFLAERYPDAIPPLEVTWAAQKKRNDSWDNTGARANTAVRLVRSLRATNQNEKATEVIQDFERGWQGSFADYEIFFDAYNQMDRGTTAMTFLDFEQAAEAFTSSRQFLGLWRNKMSEDDQSVPMLSDQWSRLYFFQATLQTHLSAPLGDQLELAQEAIEFFKDSESVTALNFACRTALLADPGPSPEWPPAFLDEVASLVGKLEGHPDSWDLAVTRAMLALRTGNYEEVEKWAEAGISEGEKLHRLDSPVMSLAIRSMARFHQKRTKEATADLDQALQNFSQMELSHHGGKRLHEKFEFAPQTSNASPKVARILESRCILNEALRLQESLLGKDDPNCQRMSEFLATVHKSRDEDRLPPPSGKDDKKQSE